MEARYAGGTCASLGNRFYADTQCSGVGRRLDRVLFKGSVSAAVHIIGQSKIFSEGLEFYRSDHFGLMAFVDVHDVYGEKGASAKPASAPYRDIGP